MKHVFIDDLYAEYLRGQIGGASPNRAKRALQDVCVLYSKGQHFKPQICPEIEVATVGQLEANRLEPKVRRWCLNVLALIGTPSRSKSAIERVIELYHNDPDTMASALTAYFKVEQNAYQSLRAKSFIGAEQIALAAYIGNFGPRIRSDATTINIEREGPALLRSALVAVGLGRAPENLFDPNFGNAELVRKLSQHDDLEVTQYAVWATSENPELGVEHLGFDVVDVGGYSANIRGWTYRLYGEADIDDGIRHEVIVEGSKDIEGEARLNLARGLKRTWYDGLEQVMCPWFHDEIDEDIREEILDHMVRQSGECSEYRRLSLEVFEAAPRATHIPKRMLAAAAGKPIYKEMKKMEIMGDDDLFGFAQEQEGKLIPMTTNNININSIQGGAISVGGNAEQTGDTFNKLTGDQTTQLKADLMALADELRSLPEQSPELKDVTALIDAASKDAEPSKLASLRSTLGAMFSGTASVAKFGGDVTKLTAMVQKVIDAIPPM